MDGRNFDDLARKLAIGVSRRNVLRGFIGSGVALGGLRGTSVLAASKVTICHFPPGNPGNLQVISVSSSALAGHLEHGDTVYGNCCVDADCAALSGACGVLAGCQADANGTSSCVYSDDSSFCDDGDACTGQETCQQSSCVAGEPMDCSDYGDQCNVGVCSGGECSAQPLGPDTGCSSGNACTTGDYCSEGACVPGNPITCDLPGECWTVGDCDPDAGCPAPVQKTPGTACGRPASCDGVIAFAGDYCDAGGYCSPGGSRQCTESQECVDGICHNVSTCRDMQETCDPSANECCNGLCRDVSRCGAEGQTQCCVTAPTQCSNSCDCCDPYSCVGGICCGNLLDLPCDDEQQVCCAGYQCLSGTCQLNNCPHAGESCTPDNNECCQDEPTDCQFYDCEPSTVTTNRCCHPSGGSCTVDCDCCSGLECTSRGVCEAPVPPPTCGANGFSCVGDAGTCCGSNAVCVGVPGHWQCAGNEGEPCRAVGTFQQGFPGATSSSVAIDCNVWGGFTCGPDLLCIVCGQPGDSCVNASSSTAGSTCCLGTAGCIDGICG